MGKRLWSWLNDGGWSVVALASVLALFAFLMLGCAAGKSPTGEIVLGFGVGKIVETGNEWLANKGAGGQLAALLLGAAGGIPVVGTIAALFGKKLLKAKDEAAEKKAEVAELKGANEEWLRAELAKNGGAA